MQYSRTDENNESDNCISRSGDRSAAVEVDISQRSYDFFGVHAVTHNTTAVGTVTVRAANSTTNVTASATATSTPEPTATATATVTAVQTDTSAMSATPTDDETTPESVVQTATTDGSGPSFGPAAVVVSLSLLLGWLGYRREGDS